MNFNPNTINRKLSKLGIKMINGRPDLSSLFKVRICREDNQVALNWCEDNFADEWLWSSSIQTDYSEFYLKSEGDAIIFKLKFGGTTA